MKVLKSVMILCFGFWSLNLIAQDDNEAQRLAKIANNPLANAYKLFFQNVTLIGDPDNANVLYSNVVVPVNLGDKWRMVNRLVVSALTLLLIGGIYFGIGTQAQLAPIAMPLVLLLYLFNTYYGIRLYKKLKSSQQCITSIRTDGYTKR